MWDALGYLVFAIAIVACLSIVGDAFNDGNGRD